MSVVRLAVNRLFAIVALCHRLVIHRSFSFVRGLGLPHQCGRSHLPAEATVDRTRPSCPLHRVTVSRRFGCLGGARPVVGGLSAVLPVSAVHRSLSQVRCRGILEGGHDSLVPASHARRLSISQRSIVKELPPRRGRPEQPPIYVNFTTPVRLCQGPAQEKKEQSVKARLYKLVRPTTGCGVYVYLPTTGGSAQGLGTPNSSCYTSVTREGSSTDVGGVCQRYPESGTVPVPSHLSHCHEFVI